MKFRKALEKAKINRENMHDQPLSSENYDNDGNQERHNGWGSPVYSQSLHKKPDLRIMEKNRCVCMFPSSPEMDYYKLLRTQIEQRTSENGWNTIMITSPNQGEGKSLTAINLALTFAKVYDQTVLLVDGDLRYQRIHHYFGFSSNSGLCNYLDDNIPLKDIIIWPGIEKMTLISGGKTVQESTELLNSPKMKSLVEELKNRYDDRYIIFDVPPLLTCADAIAFAPLVDCIVMVVEEGRTPMPDIKKALELIPREKFLGFVLNRQSINSKTYYGK